MSRGEALRGALEADEAGAFRQFSLACRDHGLTVTQQIASYIVASFVATVCDDVLETEEEWAAALLELLRDSEVGSDDEDQTQMSAAFARSAHARYSELALTWERPPQEGDSCKAVMVEDGQWHDAVLRGIDMAETPIYTVEFTEYPGKTASVGRRELCLTADGTDSDGDEGGSGTCELCARTLPLTRHHLVPRKTHARLKKKGLTVDQLMASAYICRKCHNAVHKAEDELTLALHYDTVERLLTHPKIRSFVEYNSRQPVRLKSK